MLITTNCSIKRKERDSLCFPFLADFHSNFRHHLIASLAPIQFKGKNCSSQKSRRMNIFVLKQFNCNLLKSINIICYYNFAISFENDENGNLLFKTE